MIQQQQYQPVAFNNIVPVLDIGDPSAEFIQSMSGIEQALQNDLGQIERNAATEQANIKRRNEEVDSLLKLTEEGRKLYANVSNQQTKKRLSEIFAENYNKDPETDTEWGELGANWKENAAAQQKEADDINSALATNLNKKETDPKTAASAAKIRNLTGLEATVAANARAAAASESYSSAYQTFISKANPAPGEETIRVRNEFNRLWGEQTGLATANSGFLAANVYPRIRREGARIEGDQLIGWTKQNDSKQGLILSSRLESGDMQLGEWFKAYSGLTKDGKNRYTMTELYGVLDNLGLKPGQLTTLANNSGTIPGTGIKWGDHPRFTALINNAVQRQNAEFSQNGTAIINELSMGLTGNETEDEIDAIADKAANANGAYSTQIRQWAQNAKSNGAEARQEREWDDQIKADAARNGGKLPLNYFDGKDIPFEVRYNYLGIMEEPDKQENINEQIRENDMFKDGVDKGFKDIIKGVVPGIELANDLKGTANPVNYEEFKVLALNEIANNAQLLMLGDASMTEDKAIRQAKANWIEQAKQKQAKGELFDIKGNQFKESSLTPNRGLQQAADMVFKNLRTTTSTNLGQYLPESDYTEEPKDGQYSERVRYLGQRFNMTPAEVVKAVRFQKGLAPIAPGPVEQALQGLSPAERAKITALGDSAPVPLLLRAQINDLNQTKIEGSAKQRTIAVGQHLLNLGYGGLWQHPDFNYDTGYGVGSGQVGSHAANSYHKYNEALDIGVQANGPQKLEQLYQYLLKNKQRFGIAELFYDPSGQRGHPTGHHAHVHVSFGGADAGKL